MRQWRLIYDTPTVGARNMALDEAILESVLNGEAMPTLRLYAWSPACLSLGYAQPLRDADLDRITAQGWHIVRRPTGGKAILHTDELTYSVALPADDPLASGDIIESYRRISTALMTALQRLGAQVSAERQPDGINKTINPVCFETPSHYEITVDGCKLVGSAQMRRRNGVLQHGTLPLTGDTARICDALVYPTSQAREMARTNVRARAATLQEAIGYSVDWDTAATATAAAFADTFDIDFVVDSYTPSELVHADMLETTTYSTPDFALRRSF